MNQKFSDFFSSYGLVFFGVFMIVFSSVFFTPTAERAKEKDKNVAFLSFPRSGAKQGVGGDLPAKVLPISRPSIPLKKDNVDFDQKLTAVSYLVLDDKTDKVLLSANSDQTRPLASISKLMSALVFSDLRIQWSTTTVVQADDLDTSSHQISAGEKFTLSDLWNMALIGSANGAIRALVRASGLSEIDFTALMNKKAEKLGLSSTHFMEPTGLDSGNVSTAEDVAKLLKEALKYNKIVKTMQVGEYYARPLNSNKNRRLWSTNMLLTSWVPSDLENIVGKTGYIEDSRYNFAVRLSDKDNHNLRVVILGAEADELRFSEARDLADWVFEHYSWPDQDGYEKLVE